MHSEISQPFRLQNGTPVGMLVKGEPDAISDFKKFA